MLPSIPSFPRIIVLALFAAPVVALAQARPDSARADSALQRLGAIRISAARSVGITGGAATLVIKLAELRSSPAPSLDQALRESPFVAVRQNSRGEMEISVRGSDSRQAAVLMDGVPLTLGWDHRTDPSLIPITGAEQIVIVRGLGSLLNGPNTLGGSIEISHDAFGQPAGGRWTAGAGLDQYGSTVGTVGYGRRLGEIGGGAISLLTGLAHRQRDGVALPGGAVDPTAKDGLRTGTDLTQTDGFASLRWNDRQGRALSVMTSAFDAERGVPPEEHIRSPRLWRYPYSRRQVSMVSANTGTVGTPLGQGSLEMGAGFNRGTFKIENFADRNYTTPNGSELGDERTTTARALLTHSLGGATLRASFTGADIRYAETLTPAATADYQQRLASTGVEVDAPVGARTQVSVGFVIDKSTTPQTGGRLPGQEPIDNTGWRFGVSHDATSHVRLHASVSERSRFPALRELYSGSLDRFSPNPALRPETLRGFEAGITLNQLLASVAQSSIQVIGFRHRLDDAIVRITPANSTRFQRINRDRIASSGVELLWGVVLGADPDRAISLHGDATIQSIGIFDKTANDLQRHAENNPERRGRVEVGVPLGGGLRAFATARYTGRQYCLNADTRREEALAGQAVGDLAAQREFPIGGKAPARWLRAVLSLDNVGNTAVYDQCGLPQPGRTVRVTVSVR